MQRDPVRFNNVYIYIYVYRRGKRKFIFIILIEKIQSTRIRTDKLHLQVAAYSRFSWTKVSWSMARRSGLSSRVRSSNGRRAISWTPSAPPQEPAAVAALTDNMPPICRKAALSVSLSASMQNVSSAVVVWRCVAHLVTWSRNERTLASRVCRAASISRDFLACRRLTRFATRSSTSLSSATHSSCEQAGPIRSIIISGNSSSRRLKKKKGTFCWMREIFLARFFCT